jgi:hypothetical protein
MMCNMSVPSDTGADPAGSAPSNGGTTAEGAEQGVLSQLPHTRPQRSSPRRAASRRAGQAGGRLASSGAAEPSPKARSAAASPSTAKSAAKPAKARASATRGAAAQPRKAPPRAQARRRPPSAPPPPPVPRQGFESDSDRAHGPVTPPGGAELLTSAVEIVGELAQAGLATGERLIRSLLPRS